MSKDWCPENDGAYRDEMNAIHNRKIEEMMESYYGLEVALSVLFCQSRQVSQPNPYTTVHQVRYTGAQKSILDQALWEVKQAMIEMCESKLLR